MNGQQFNGPAFPVGNGWHQDKSGSTVEAAGMTLRDYFAAKAMAALIGRVPHPATPNSANITQVAYIYADAMLSARSAA